MGLFPQLRCAATSSRVGARSRSKSKVMLSDLPVSKLDDEGNSVGPLEAFIEARPGRKGSVKSELLG